MPTLLLIDDNALARELLRFIFEYVGFTVVTAENGAQGLVFVEQHTVDAAIVNIDMPGMNGFDVCRQLRTRAQSSGQDVPVWLITGALTSDFPRRAAEAGAVTILSKPFDVTALEREIRGRIGTH